MAPTKSSRSPAFQFYPKDFFSSSKVDDMSMTERGIYITLLARCWLDHGLPADMKSLAKIARMKPVQFERLWTSGRLHECFYERGGLLHNERLDRERKAQVEFRRKQKERADARWHPKDGNATALPMPHQSGNALQSSSAICNLQSASALVPRVPIVGKRKLYAAWEGAKGLYVPNQKHADFVALRNHSGAESELLAWYEHVAETWTGSPGADMIKFWTARFEEKWPAVQVATRKGVPSWAP